MSPTFLPLAFGFGNLLMLGWLAAAGLPLLIHLWNKRTHQEIPWAAMEYLLAAMKNNSRRIRIEEWLLLTIRTLLLVLVVLAMAELYLENANLAILPGSRAHKLLVIDDSYSMGYKPGDTTRFDRAKQLAREIVQQSSLGDGFTLLTLSSPPRAVIRSPSFDRKSLLEEIDNLRLVHGKAELPATLQEVEKILATSEREHPQLIKQEVYFLTDLGRNTWAPDFANAESAADFHDRAQRLKEISTLVVIDLGQAQAENMAVTTLEASERFITVGQTANLQATVHNFGVAPHQQTLELDVDGQRVEQSEVSVEPGRSSVVRFVQRFAAPGNHRLEARLTGDALDVDNHRWLSLAVKENIQVLCVDGKPRGAESAGATFLLTRLLDQRDTGGASPSIRATSLPESALAETDLSGFDCVILSNVAQFTASEASRLDTFLKQGGGLIFFLGDRVLPDRYNQELLGESGGRAKIFPAKLLGVSGESAYTFDPLDYRHRLLDAFRGNEQGGLTRETIYKYMRMKLPEKSQAETVMTFRETGDPAIVEEHIHAGRSIVVATPAAIDERNPWNVWLSGKNGPVMLFDLVAEAVGSQAAQRNLTVGTALEAGAPAATPGTSLTLQLPDGRKESIRPSAAGDAARWSFNDTSLSGFYRLDAGSNSPEQTFAINLNTAESDLAKLDPADLPKEFVARTNWQDLGTAPASELKPRAGADRWLLYCVLGLLLAETALAWHLGQRRG